MAKDNSSNQNATTVQITVNYQSLPSVSINDVVASEGNSGTSNAVFTVTLSATSSQTVTVSYSTADGTATAGSDYLAASGVVTFNPGEVSKPMSISVIGDTVVEPNETFFVNLTSATNAIVAKGQGAATILDDDVPASPEPFSNADLAGTWYFHSFSDSPSVNDPGWNWGNMTMDASGTVTGGSLLDSDGSSSTVTGGSFSLSSNGMISGSFTRNQGGMSHTSTIMQGKIDANKAMASFVFTDDEGYRNLFIGIKDEGVFSTADLTGTWYFYSFDDSPAFNDPGWRRGTMTMNASGTVTGGSLVDSDGSSSTVTGGSFSLSGNGVMSGSFTADSSHTSSITQGQMDANKAMVSFVFTDDGGYQNIGIAIKTGGTFATADLAGTWYWYAFADSPSANYPVWSRGIMTMDSSGTITSGSAVDSDGGSLSSGGSFSSSSNGVISGSFTRNQGGIIHASTITQGKIDASKRMGAFVFTDDGGYRNVVIAIKDTSSGPLAMNVSSLPAGEVGARYDASLGVSGGEPPYSLSVTKGSLPSGLSIAGEDLVGTPTPAGKKTFTIRVTDQLGASVSRKYTLTINKAIAISSSSLKAGRVGRNYGATLKAMNGQKPYTWSIVSGALPAGLGFNGSTGTISGVPVSAGSATIIFQVNDPAGGKAQKTLTIMIK